MVSDGVVFGSRIEVLVRGRRTHDTLVAAANELFQDLGYTKVGIRAIVEKAGVPKGTFYNYFSSKEALASLVVEQQFESLMATLPSGSHKISGVKLAQYFRKITERKHGHRTSPARLLVTFAAEAPALPPLVAKQISVGFRIWSDRLSELILRVKPDAKDAHHLADFLVNSWQGATIRSKCDSTNESLRNFVRMASQVLL